MQHLCSRPTTTMEESFSFHEIIKRIFRICQFFGVWLPRKGQENYHFLRLKFLSIWAIDSLFNFGLVVFILQNTDDLEPATMSCFSVISLYNIQVKKIVATFNEKKIKSLAKEFDDEIFSPVLESQKKLFRSWWIAFVSLVPWILAIWTRGSTKIVLIPGAFPFDIKNYLGWGCACIFQTVALIHASQMVINLDAIFVWFLMFIGVQCDLLCDSLEHLENDHEKFARCVKHHKAILSVKLKMQTLFSGQMTSQFSASTGMILFCLVQLSRTQAGSWMFIISCSYLLVASFQLFLYCWFGNEIIYKSKRIPDAATKSDWPKFDNGLKRKLVFFIARCQHEIKLEFMEIFDVSVLSFIKVIRTAYSYFSVLKVYYEKSDVAGATN